MNSSIFSDNSGSYVRTDLAAEAISESSAHLASAPCEQQYDFGSVVSLDIESEAVSKLYGKPVGRYVTLSFGRLWNMERTTIDSLIASLTDELVHIADRAAPNRRSVLVAGLGNPYMTADALGPLAVRQINVTRHLSRFEPSLFEALEVCEVAALVPGVVGQTGIETLELIRGAVRTVKPDLLVVIDALASRSADRLASTVQLTDSGISPGSGVGNHRMPISFETTGVPTIAVGAPTVVSSSTLVYDALEKAGVSEISDELHSVLDNGRGFFVSLKECDTAVNELASLIGTAVNEAFSAVL